jgi:hypothetical protein
MWEGIPTDVRQGERAVLTALIWHSNERYECWPGVKRLCRLTAYSREHVLRCLKSLRDRGLIVRLPRRGGIRPNRYRVCIPVEREAAVSNRGDSDDAGDSRAPPRGDISRAMGDSDATSGVAPALPRTSIELERELREQLEDRESPKRWLSPQEFETNFPVFMKKRRNRLSSDGARSTLRLSGAPGGGRQYGHRERPGEPLSLRTQTGTSRTGRDTRVNCSAN